MITFGNERVKTKDGSTKSSVEVQVSFCHISFYHYLPPDIYLFLPWHPGFSIHFWTIQSCSLLAAIQIVWRNNKYFWIEIEYYMSHEPRGWWFPMFCVCVGVWRGGGGGGRVGKGFGPLLEYNPFTPQFRKYILPTYKEKMYVSEVPRIGSIFIFDLSKLWKSKFVRLCDVIFLLWPGVKGLTTNPSNLLCCFLEFDIIENLFGNLSHNLSLFCTHFCKNTKEYFTSAKRISHDCVFGTPGIFNDVTIFEHSFHEQGNTRSKV